MIRKCLSSVLGRAGIAALLFAATIAARPCFAQNPDGVETGEIPKASSNLDEAPDDKHPDKVDVADDDKKDDTKGRRRRVINIEDELSPEELELLKQQEEPELSLAEQENLPFQVPEETSKLPEYALIVTTKGPFEVKLFRNLTPISVANFKHLIEKGTYEGVAFHRYVPGFVIQGGDPTGTERGGPGWTLPPEMNSEIHHVRGTIGWARKSGKRNPERRSNGSQFYVCLQPQPRLDGFYTAFGVVVKGMENVDNLRPGDKILKVKLPLDYRQEQEKTKKNNRRN